MAEDLDDVLCVSVVLFGASGDLAIKKTVPALFRLFGSSDASGLFKLLGAARSDMSTDEWRRSLRPFLPRDVNATTLDAFLSRCTYIRLPVYDVDGGTEGYALLGGVLDEHEHTVVARSGDASITLGRLFYMALPPNVYGDVVTACRQLLTPPKDASSSVERWERLILEKPFGHDERSAVALDAIVGNHFPERSIYRIDHFLGKELVSNLLALRFANALWEPVLNAAHVECVLITMKEDIDVASRGGFFDSTGIVRDVIQNHLLQVACLVAMERPVSLCADDVRDEKLKALRAFLPPVRPADIVLGQYAGYQSTQGVNPGSKTPTFAAVVLRSCSPRWEGVPFILRAGKALNERKTEIRIQFKPPPGTLLSSWPPLAGPQPTPAGRDELVIRVQPNEAIYMKQTVKAPGLSSHSMTPSGQPKSCHAIATTLAELDLNYSTRYGGTLLPDAYETLLADCIFHGDSSNFVRSDFVRQAWRLFDPMLAASEVPGAPSPIPYARGSRGPEESDALVAAEGYVRSQGYVWRK